MTILRPFPLANKFDGSLLSAKWLDDKKAQYSVAKNP